MFELQVQAVSFYFDTIKTSKMWKSSSATGSALAVDQVSLSIGESDSLSIIGSSGSGKSTLARICTGLLSPTSGQVSFRGKSIAVPETLAELRTHIGFMPQSAALFPHLTISANATLGLRHSGVSAKECNKRAAELLERVKLPLSLANRYPHEISGGQAQRVSLMRALATDPACLILDEPLSALDPVVRCSLQDDLKELVDDLKKTLVIVTHDLAEAQHLTQHSCLLSQGQMLQMGPISELIHRPANEAVATFVGSQRSLIK